MTVNWKESTPCVKKVCHCYFHDNLGNSLPIFIFFSLLNSERFYGERERENFIRNCTGELELNYYLLLNLLPHYLAKRKWSTIHLYIHISENKMLHVRWHLFH